MLNFLKSIKRNNNREWFEKHKETYSEAKEEFTTLVTKVYEGLTQLDPALTGQDPAKLIFRIYRDVRFSKDKKPYKENFAAGFSSGGKAMGEPGYYLHIEPGNKSFVAVGLFQPQPELLAKVRQEIDYNGANLEAILKTKNVKKYFQEFWTDDKLKRVPKGFPVDHPYAEWLKLKSFIMTAPFTDEQVTSLGFHKNVLKALEAGQGLKKFLEEALN